MQNTCCFHLLDPKKLNGLPWRLSGKESACQCRRCRFNPSVGEIPWRREWQPTPLFLPGKSHEQRSLAGYSPPVHKESDTVYRLAKSQVEEGGLMDGPTGCYVCFVAPLVEFLSSPMTRTFSPFSVPTARVTMQALINFYLFSHGLQTILISYPPLL